MVVSWSEFLNIIFVAALSESRDMSSSFTDGEVY